MAPKFNFIPESQLTHAVEQCDNKIGITKQGGVYYSKNFIQSNGLKDRYLKFYGDPAKGALAWKIMSSAASLPDMKGLRKIKPNKSEGGTVSVSALLSKIGWKKGESYKNLPVRKYSSSLLEGELYYVEIKK